MATDATPAPLPRAVPRPEDAESLAELVADGELVDALLPHAAGAVVIPDQAVRLLEGLGSYGD